MTDETGRIEAAAEASHVFAAPDARHKVLTRRGLVAADLWDLDHGIVRVDTRDEAVVEKIARALAGRYDHNAGMYRPGARAVLAALRGES